MPVVDASVVVDRVAPDADPDGPARRLLNRLAREGANVLAPRLMLEEVANALLTGVRRQRWDGASADTAFQLLMALPVEIADVPGDLERAWDLSRLRRAPRLRHALRRGCGTGRRATDHR